MAASNANSGKPSQSVSALVLRTGLPDRRTVIFLGIGPFAVFLGEFEKTATQDRIDRIAGETAASLGLFAKMEMLRHLTRPRNKPGVSLYCVMTFLRIVIPLYLFVWA
jgi:hypothetical protein